MLTPWKVWEALYTHAIGNLTKQGVSSTGQLWVLHTHPYTMLVSSHTWPPDLTLQSERTSSQKVLCHMPRMGDVLPNNIGTCGELTGY